MYCLVSGAAPFFQDPVDDADLMWLAEDAAVAHLPEGWEAALDSNHESPMYGREYYWHESNPSQPTWDHPLDSQYRSIIARLKMLKQQAKAAATERSHDDDEGAERKRDSKSPSRRHMPSKAWHRTRAGRTRDGGSTSSEAPTTSSSSDDSTDRRAAQARQRRRSAHPRSHGADSRKNRHAGGSQTSRPAETWAASGTGAVLGGVTSLVGWVGAGLAGVATAVKSKLTPRVQSSDAGEAQSVRSNRIRPFDPDNTVEVDSTEPVLSRPPPRPTLSNEQHRDISFAYVAPDEVRQLLQKMRPRAPMYRPYRVSVEVQRMESGVLGATAILPQDVQDMAAYFGLDAISVARMDAIWLLKAALVWRLPPGWEADFSIEPSMTEAGEMEEAAILLTPEGETHTEDHPLDDMARALLQVYVLRRDWLASEHYALLTGSPGSPGQTVRSASVFMNEDGTEYEHDFGDGDAKVPDGDQSGSQRRPGRTGTADAVDAGSSSGTVPGAGDGSTDAAAPKAGTGAADSGSGPARRPIHRGIRAIAQRLTREATNAACRKTSAHMLRHHPITATKLMVNAMSVAVIRQAVLQTAMLGGQKTGRAPSSDRQPQALRQHQLALARALTVPTFQPVQQADEAEGGRVLVTPYPRHLVRIPASISASKASIVRAEVDASSKGRAEAEAAYQRQLRQRWMLMQHAVQLYVRWHHSTQEMEPGSPPDGEGAADAQSKDDNDPANCAAHDGGDAKSRLLAAGSWGLLHATDVAQLERCLKGMVAHENNTLIRVVQETERLQTQRDELERQIAALIRQSM